MMVDIYMEQNNAKPVVNSKVYIKVFAYFGLALLVTAVTAFIVSSILFNLMGNANTFYWTYLGITIGSAIAMIVLSLIMSFNYFKAGSKLIIPYILYSISVGCLISGCAFWVDSAYSLGMVFLATALIFFIMCGIGALLGDKIKFVYMILSMFLIGALLLSLVNLFIMPFLFVNEAAWQSVSTIYWISEFLFLAIFCLYIAIDMNRLKKYAENSLTIETNLALFFAMSLYTDFINLFVRLLYIFALTRNNN